MIHIKSENRSYDYRDHYVSRSRWYLIEYTLIRQVQHRDIVNSDFFCEGLIFAKLRSCKGLGK